MSSYKNSFGPIAITYHLKEYQKLVKERKYNRIDYEVWKVFINTKVPIRIEYIYESERIYFYKETNNPIGNVIYNCTLKDNDFGAYIYSILEEQIERYKPSSMAVTNSTTSISINAKDFHPYADITFRDDSIYVEKDEFNSLQNRVNYLEYQINKPKEEKETSFGYLSCRRPGGSCLV